MSISYRIYAHFSGALPSTQADVHCLDDHEALQVATDLIAAGGTADVWEGTRYVRRVIASGDAGRGTVNLDELFKGNPVSARRVEG